jgi:hypothetical protein
VHVIGENYWREKSRTYADVFICISIFLLMCPWKAYAQADPPGLPRQATLAWPEVDLYSEVGPRLDLTLLSQVRLSGSLPNPAVYVFGVDANVVLNKFLVVTPSYYFYGFDQQGASFGYGHNLILAATVGASWRQYQLDERNRVVGVLGKDTAYWVYGTRARVERTLGNPNRHDYVFLWDELFYFADTSAWQRNRIAVGLHKRITKKMAIEPYYLQQTDGHSRPGDLNTFGIIFEVRLQ